MNDLERARCYRRQGSVEKALQEYQRIVDTSAHVVQLEALLGGGWCAEQLCYFDLAQQFYAKASVVALNVYSDDKLGKHFESEALRLKRLAGEDGKEREIPFVSLGLVGDSRVGKTTAIETFCGGMQTVNSGHSAGLLRRIRLSCGAEVRLMLYEYQSPERYYVGGRRPLPWPSLEGVFVLFDLTSAESWRNVKQWLQEVERYGRDYLPRSIVANKLDLSAQRVVQVAEVNELCECLGIRCFETCAKDASTIEPCVLYLAERAYYAKLLDRRCKQVGPPELLMRLQCFPSTGCDAITHLDLRGNCLTSVPREVLRFRNLASLDLRDNQLAELPLGLFSLPCLWELLLDGNPLPASITESAFRDLATASRMESLRSCRRSVLCILLIHRFRQSVWSCLNRDALLVILRDVWVSRWECSMWLKWPDDMWVSARKKERMKASCCIQ